MKMIICSWKASIQHLNEIEEKETEKYRARRDGQSLTESNSCDRSKKTYDDGKGNRDSQCLGTQFIDLRQEPLEHSKEKFTTPNSADYVNLFDTASSECKQSLKKKHPKEAFTRLENLVVVQLARFC